VKPAKPTHEDHLRTARACCARKGFFTPADLSSAAGTTRESAGRVCRSWRAKGLCERLVRGGHEVPSHYVLIESGIGEAAQ
jgi:hypothetical protein